jgi:hypothetical protein
MSLPVTPAAYAPAASGGSARSTSQYKRAEAQRLLHEAEEQEKAGIVVGGVMRGTHAFQRLLKRARNRISKKQLNFNPNVTNQPNPKRSRVNRGNQP